MRLLATIGAPSGFETALKSGAYQLGTFVQVPSPELVELFGLAGFDFVVLDLEHGAFGFDQLRDLLRAAEVRSLTPIVRVGELSPSLMSRVMDLGAAAVMVPQVRTVDDVRAVIDATKYPPLGARGYCSGVRAAGYLGAPGFSSMANDRTSVIPLIENPDAVAALDSILTLPGVEAIMVGPGDLSSAMGRPGDWLTPPVSDLLNDIVSRALRQGVAVGMHVKEAGHAAAWHEKGVRFFTYGMDAQVILQHLSQLRDAVASAVLGSHVKER